MVDTPIVSEALQKDFRDNFPSQVNSGRDLHVSDVIVPVVDFSTSTAISGLETSLQQALDFNSITFDISGTSSTVITSTPGFYRVIGSYSSNLVATFSGSIIGFALDDGTTTKMVYNGKVDGTSSGSLFIQANYDFIVFLKTGVSLKGVTNSSVQTVVGSARQIADISGTLVNPDGYTGS